MLRSALLISTMAFVWALGCGGRENGTSSNASTGSSGSSSSGANRGASAGDASTVAERNPQCPATVPTAGDSCKPPLECEYGADSHRVCTTVAEGGIARHTGAYFTWYISPPATG